MLIIVIIIVMIIDVDECENSPCLRESLCTNIPGSYICDCQPGFTGNLCDSGIIWNFIYMKFKCNACSLILSISHQSYWFCT